MLTLLEIIVVKEQEADEGQHINVKCDIIANIVSKLIAVNLFTKSGPEKSAQIAQLKQEKQSEQRASFFSKVIC